MKKFSGNQRLPLVFSNTRSFGSCLKVSNYFSQAMSHFNKETLPFTGKSPQETKKEEPMNTEDLQKHETSEMRPLGVRAVVESPYSRAKFPGKSRQETKKEEPMNTKDLQKTETRAMRPQGVRKVKTTYRRAKFPGKSPQETKIEKKSSCKKTFTRSAVPEHFTAKLPLNPNLVDSKSTVKLENSQKAEDQPVSTLPVVGTVCEIASTQVKPIPTKLSRRNEDIQCHDV